MMDNLLLGLLLAALLIWLVYRNEQPVPRIVPALMAFALGASVLHMWSRGIAESDGQVDLSDLVRIAPAAVLIPWLYFSGSLRILMSRRALSTVALRRSLLDRAVAGHGNSTTRDFGPNHDQVARFVGRVEHLSSREWKEIRERSTLARGWLSGRKARRAAKALEVERLGRQRLGALSALEDALGFHAKEWARVKGRDAVILADRFELLMIANQAVDALVMRPFLREEEVD